MSAVKKYFEQNPEATECFTALGLVRGNTEEASRLCGGVMNAKVTRHERPADEEKATPVKQSKKANTK